jgi:hypothetical protein
MVVWVAVAAVVVWVVVLRLQLAVEAVEAVEAVAAVAVAVAAVAVHVTFTPAPRQLPDWSPQT